MAKEKLNNNHIETSPGTDGKLAAIKEIIFGQEQAEFRKEIEELKAIVSTLYSAFRSELQDLNDKMDDSMKSINADLNKKLEVQKKVMQKEILRIEKKEKGNQKLFGEMLINLGENILKDQ